MRADLPKLRSARASAWVRLVFFAPALGNDGCRARILPGPRSSKSAVIMRDTKKRKHSFADRKLQLLCAKVA